MREKLTDMINQKGYATEKESVEAIIQLLKTNNEAKAEMHFDNEALFRIAAEYGWLDLIELLIELTPDPKARGQMIHVWDDKPFNWAYSKGYIKVMELLIKYSPTQEQRDNMIHDDGYDGTFMCAATDNDIDMMKLLLNHTQNPILKENMLHRKDDKVFMATCEQGSFEAVCLLIELTPDPKALSKMLHKLDDHATVLAARKNKFNIVKKIWDHSTDAERMNMVNSAFCLVLAEFAEHDNLEAFDEMLNLIPNIPDRDQIIRRVLDDKDDSVYLSAVRSSSLNIMRRIEELTQKSTQVTNSQPLSNNSSEAKEIDHINKKQKTTDGQPLSTNHLLEEHKESYHTSTALSHLKPIQEEAKVSNHNLSLTSNHPNSINGNNNGMSR